ncbi:MAG: N-formylglutamate amidohydrolase [Burkholderiales bacterium]|nr:N-formylglutamate amidohydrolase [Burkholderiales bacterium]
MADFSAVDIRTPHAGVAPIALVLDSPHSGRHYPADFRFACDFVRLRRAEDTDVDDLFGDAPALGATLVCAGFPRSYLDPNRRVEDIDISMLDGRWPHAVDHSPKTRAGIGLIWRVLDDNSAIYARKLSVAEVEARIALCHAPYWHAVTEAIETTYGRFGRVFHLNCHSMPAVAGPLSWVAPGTAFADVVLGDRDGSTCSGEFRAVVAEAVRDEGLRVAINDPFKGVELVKRFGRPAVQRHSMQIELNRKLYMDETTRERSANYGALKAALNRVLKKIADFANTKPA